MKSTFIQNNNSEKYSYKIVSNVIFKIEKKFIYFAIWNHICFCMEMTCFCL